MHEWETRTRISVEVEPHGSVWGALAAAAATGEHWRGNRAWCAVCGDPIRAHPKSVKPFRARPTPVSRCHVGPEVHLLLSSK